MARHRSQWARVALAPALISAACGAGGGPAPLPEPTPVTSKAFLYALTDVDHTIRGFEVVPADGTLKPTFTLAGCFRMSADPDGRWLFVCGQESGQEEPTLQTWAIGRDSGALSFLSSISTEFVSPRATRGVVYGGFSWYGSSSGKLYRGWVGYRVDPATGRLAVPTSREWALRGGGGCALSVGPATDFGFADCEPYYSDHAFRSWSIEPEGRWREVDAVEVSEEPYEYAVCGDKLLAVVESEDIGVSVYDVDSATGHLTYRARTVLDLQGTENITCGPGGLVALGKRLFRVDDAGSLGPLGALGIPGGPRLAFHPAGGFLYGWREDAQQPSLVTLAVAESGETAPFAETPVSGHMSHSGTILVTQPAP
jgi:hypothetical protein